jgi:hypothetical protein
MLTKDATLDDLSAGDYRDIYIELRRLRMEPKDRLSYDRFIAMVGSTTSKAYWAQYDAGLVTLNRKMRNDLRRGCGIDELPPTVTEAVGAASPDAAVWQVGEGVPETVIMVGAEPVTLYVNGGVSEVVENAHVTQLQGATRTRKHNTRVWIPETQNDRFMRLRDGLGELTWREVQDAGLKYFERMLKGDE